MARITKTTVKVPQVAGETSVAVKEPPAEDPPVAAVAVQAPKNGLAIATANGVKAVKLCRTCGAEMLADSPHNHCETCFREYLGRKAKQRGKVLCATTGCNTFVYPRPDGQKTYCLACRLAYAEQRAKGTEAEPLIAEAMASFQRGEGREAAEKLSEANRLLVQLRAEKAMAAFIPAGAPAEALRLFDEAQEHFEASRFRQAADAAWEAKRVARRAAVLERARLAEADRRVSASDRGARRAQEQRRQARSQRDRRIREAMKGYNPSPPRGRR